MLFKPRAENRFLVFCLRVQSWQGCAIRIIQDKDAVQKFNV